MSNNKENLTPNEILDLRLRVLIAESELKQSFSYRAKVAFNTIPTAIDFLIEVGKPISYFIGLMIVLIVGFSPFIILFVPIIYDNLGFIIFILGLWGACYLIPKNRRW